MSRTNKLLAPIKNEPPKIICYFKPFFLSLLFYGFNYNHFTSNRLLKVLSVAYCVFISTIFCYGSFMCCKNLHTTYWVLIEYVSFVIIAFICRRQTGWFFSKLQAVDVILRIPLKWNVQFNRFLMTNLCLIIVSRLLYTVAYCLQNDCWGLVIYYTINFAMLTALDLYRFWRCAVFGLIYFRIRKFRQRFVKESGSLYMFVTQNKTQLGNKLRVFLQLYVKVYEIVEYANVELHASLFISVCSSLPKLVYNTYNLILAIENKELLDSIGFTIVHLFLIGIFLFGPFLAVEFWAMEVEYIQQFLVTQLIYETDHDTKKSIKHFLKFIELHNFRYKVWRIIPLSIVFPFELFNICTNYVIVLINYSHLYD